MESTLMKTAEVQNDHFIETNIALTYAFLVLGRAYRTKSRKDLDNTIGARPRVKVPCLLVETKTNFDF